MTACKKWEFIHEHTEACNSSYGIRDHFILLGLTCIFYIFSNEHYWLIPKIGSNALEVKWRNKYFVVGKNWF